MRLKAMLMATVLLSASDKLIVTDKHNPVYDSTCHPFISIIENVWERNGITRTKLSEREGIYTFNKKFNIKMGLRVQKAVNEGRPLVFSTSGRVINKIFEPEKQKADLYLRTYDTVYYYQPSELYSNFRQSILTNAKLSLLFHRYINEEFRLPDKISLEIGCEARAGMVSKFLREKVKLISYKLFMSGEIRMRVKHKTFEWVNHVSVIVSFLENGKRNLYIADPFIAEFMIPFDQYLNLLMECGTKNIQYRITDESVFVCYLNYNRGIRDNDYQYSKSIFRNLYQ